jgi:DEAD/DEAH box helicase domain-containing protein
VESQFKITLKQGPDERDLGSVSYGQLMREAYPGAVYYHAARTYRSYRILTNQKIIQVRKEKRYTTKPQNIPTLVYPNFTSDNIYRSRKHSELIAVECNLQIQESIVGFKERRGSNEFNCNYPTNQSETGVAFDLPYFTRRYFSTGIILTHPVFNQIGVEVDKIANLAYEACLLTIPFEHRDIGYATDKHRSDRIGINKGDKFIAIYDQTYGSLRLSGRFLEEKVFREVFQVVVENIDNETLNLNRETKEAVKIIRESLDQEGINFSFEDGVVLENTSERVRVICPKSRGINIYRNNEEFLVDKVSFHPSIPNELSYSGRHISNKNATVKERIPVSHLVEIPGESSVGWYDCDSEEIEGCS